MSAGAEAARRFPGDALLQPIRQVNLTPWAVSRLEEALLAATHLVVTRKENDIEVCMRGTTVDTVEDGSTQVLERPQQQQQQQ